MSILQARRYLPLTSSGGLAAAWTSFTPTVVSSAGTITTVGTKSARTLKLGRLVFYQVSAAITTNGTGSGDVRVTNMPYTCAAFNFYGSGRENALTGKMLESLMVASTTILTLFNYDNSYPGADGAVLQASGFYEAAS